MWLLSKNRLKEAEKSLQWLRGWVPASAVQKELNELVRYCDNSRLVLPEKKRQSTEATAHSAAAAAAGGMAYANPTVSLEDEGQRRPDAPEAVEATSAGCGGGPAVAAAGPTAVVPHVERKATLKERLGDMVRPQMLKPMMLVVAFFTFHNGSGFPAMRPYMVNVFEELEFPVDAHWATVSFR